MGQNLTWRYHVRRARSEADLRATKVLRAKAFAGIGAANDSDKFDDVCHHILIEDTTTQKLVGCFRLMHLNSGQDIGQSYSTQFYGLDALKSFSGRMMEIGRFCTDPDVRDPEILRVAWGALTHYVDENAVQMLFGCSSFEGQDTERYQDTFALLKARYLAPKQRMPEVKAHRVFRYSEKARQLDLARAQANMPPLLRSYLLMGGWVSDHAVIDEELNTLHVFTGLEISAIPEARKRLLRANAVKIA